MGILDVFCFYDEHKLKSMAQMGCNRIKIHNDKRTNLIQNKSKREIANMISEKNVELARIRCEHVIRDDFLVEAYSIVKLQLELISERSTYITSSTDIPIDLHSAMVTIIWSSEQMDIQELREVARQLKLKYGNEFYKNAIKNKGELVNERVIHKMSPRPPDAHLVEAYMRDIAKEYNLSYKIESKANKPHSAPTGLTVGVAPASGITTAYINDNVPDVMKVSALPDTVSNDLSIKIEKSEIITDALIKDDDNANSTTDLTELEQNLDIIDDTLCNKTEDKVENEMSTDDLEARFNNL